MYVGDVENISEWVKRLCDSLEYIGDGICKLADAVEHHTQQLIAEMEEDRRERR